MANDDNNDKGPTFTAPWALARAERLFKAVDQQEDELVELLGPDFNPLDIVYRENLTKQSPQALIADLLNSKSEDEYTYHHDLLGAAMDKQRIALTHFELQLALLSDFARVREPGGRIHQAAREDHNVIESLDFKIRDIHANAVGGALKDDFTEEIMRKHYEDLSPRFAAATRGDIAPELVDLSRADLLQRIERTRLDYAAINIGHAALQIGMVNNLIADLERVQRFLAEGVISDAEPVVHAMIVTYATMREAHQSVKIQLDTSNELARSTIYMREKGQYRAVTLNHTL